jgi:hypothetical protein
VSRHVPEPAAGRHVPVSGPAGRPARRATPAGAAHEAARTDHAIHVRPGHCAQSLILQPRPSWFPPRQESLPQARPVRKVLRAATQRPPAPAEEAAAWRGCCQGRPLDELGGIADEHRQLLRRQSGAKAAPRVVCSGGSTPRRTRPPSPAARRRAIHHRAACSQARPRRCILHPSRFNTPERANRSKPSRHQLERADRRVERSAVHHKHRQVDIFRHRISQPTRPVRHQGRREGRPGSLAQGRQRMPPAMIARRRGSARSQLGFYN